MSRDTILEQALTLSPDDRVQLIDELLESITDSAGCSELTDAQQRELIRRLEADHADPNAAVSWEQAEKRITEPS